MNENESITCLINLPGPPRGAGPRQAAPPAFRAIEGRGEQCCILQVAGTWRPDRIADESQRLVVRQPDTYSRRLRRGRRAPGSSQAGRAPGGGEQSETLQRPGQ